MSNRLVKYVQDFLDAEALTLGSHGAGDAKFDACRQFEACRQQLEEYLESPLLNSEDRLLADKVWAYIEAVHHFEHAQKGENGPLETAAKMLDTAQRDLEGMLYQFTRYGGCHGKDCRKRLLVAVDDQAPADWALQTAIELADTMPGRLMLLHIVPENYENAADSGRYEETAAIFHRHRAEELLDQKKAAVPSDLSCSTLIREGDAATEIIKTARRWGADYIVMGTRGRGRLARFILGSVAEAVLRRASCPVIAVGHEPNSLRIATQATQPRREAEPASA